MDWYMPNDPTHVRTMRMALSEHLTRHAETGADIEGALIVASELITNAIQNSERDIWISLDWGSPFPQLTVHDLGAGFDLSDVPHPSPQDVTGRGLLIASHLVPELKVSAKQSGGSIVTATLPVKRAPSRNIDPPRSTVASLPADSEMQADGTYDRESFLRALVVQLAQTAELLDGPDAAEALIAQVGTDVGGRMESAYRAARDLEEALTVEQMSELFVTLKDAIGGDFSVLEANEERIVLVNTCCPFGEAVTRAPALCRMTSSVFGGIARRNIGASAVDLEQRIAVGDNGCRVTVWLKSPGEDRAPFVHSYGDFASPVV